MRAKHVTTAFDSVSQGARAKGPFVQKTRLAIYHLSTFSSTIHSFLIIVFCYEVCMCIKRDFVVPRHQFT